MCFRPQHCAGEYRRVGGADGSGSYGHQYCRYHDDSAAPVDVYAQQQVSKQGSSTGLFNSPVQTISAAGTSTLDALSGSLSDTAGMMQGLDLWAPNNPKLYTVTTSLMVGGSVVDTYTTSNGTSTRTAPSPAYSPGCASMPTAPQPRTAQTSSSGRVAAERTNNGACGTDRGHCRRHMI